MSVFKSVSKSVFSSVHRSTSVPYALAGSGETLGRTASLAYYDAVVNAGGTINEARASKAATLISSIVDSGLARYIKCLYLFLGGTEASASLNALNPTSLVGAFKGTFVGSPTLNTDGGFTPASGKYFTSGFHPDGGGLTDLTGGGMFFYGTSDITGGTYPIGLASTFYFTPNANGSSALVRCSGLESTPVAAVATDGFHWAGREANSSTIKAYRNGTQYISETISFDTGYATGYPTTTARIGGRRDQATPADNASTMPLRLAGFTKGMTSTQVASLNTLIQAYI